MSWSLLATEYWLSALALAILVIDLLATPERCRAYLRALVPGGLAVGLVITAGNQARGVLWDGAFILDDLAVYFRLLFLLAACITAIMTNEHAKTQSARAGAFYLLVILATIGMCFLASAGELIMMFVALELITFSFYIMTAYLTTEHRSIEAGLKYLLIGAVATGCLVYGSALLYGWTGSTQFAAIGAALNQTGPSAGVVLALLLILASFGFKISAVPFHTWVPDVYEGAPTPVGAFLSVGSKAAGFAVLVRFITTAAAPLADIWTVVLGTLAAISMCYGNLAAMPQTNFKRLLGYSSIGHGGYLLIGVAAGSVLGTTAVAFYLLAYLFTNLAAFLVLLAVAQATGSDELDALAGLSRRSPFLAAALFIALLSLAGVPPLAGFFGKFLLLMAAVNSGYVWLAAIGALNVVFSLYYYLRVVKRAYIDPATDASAIPVARDLRLALALCVIAILCIGIVQAPFVHLAGTAVASLLP